MDKMIINVDEALTCEKICNKINHYFTKHNNPNIKQILIIELKEITEQINMLPKLN